MHGIKRVLAVVDTRKREHIALSRAIQVAKGTDCTLYLLSTNPRPTQKSATQLKALEKQVADQGVECISQETWRNTLVETILHVREVNRCHLVIKDYRAESLLEKTIKTPADWVLLRQSTVPVLLVRHDRPWTGKNVLAAINADPDDTDHQDLNQAILKSVMVANQVFDSKVHLATAYPVAMLATQEEHLQPDKERYDIQCNKFASHYGIDPAHVHVRPAPADTMIPELTRELRAELLVMGSHARTGISAVTLGNTAEQLIRYIDCDLLSVQPRHHMTPLERELEQ